MPIAVISDVHGNHLALEAVLADIRRQKVDRVVCLGDVATIGPQPRETLTRLKTLECSFVAGNHDAALLDPDAALRYQIAPPLIPSLHWCAGQLTGDDLHFLRSFQSLIEISLGDGASMLCFHGSPRSNIDMILATTPAEELDTLFADRSATILAGGHTHIQMLRRHRGKLILNPGSVGHPFLETAPPGAAPVLLPWAEYTIANWVRGILSVELRRVPFDMAAFSEAIRLSDIPIKDWLMEQYSSEAKEG